MNELRTLTYGKKGVRVQVGHDGLWFAAADLFAACNRRTDRACLSRFDPDHLRPLSFPTAEGGEVRLTAVSPLGAQTVAASLPMPQCRFLDGWVRNQTRQLAAEFGFHDLPVMSLLADGRMPPKPRVSSDYYRPWHELRLAAPASAAKSENRYEPALFDDGPRLPPHALTEGDAAVAAIMAAGEAAMAREASRIGGRA